MDKSIVKKLISIRRTIHKNPELGYQETETSQLIARELTKLEIPFKTGIAKTGIIATIKKGKGKCVVLRADMDALPFDEATSLPFASKNKGKMHACGHDIHTTMLLGACMLLKEMDFKGKIKFIFQPSEEGIYDDPEKKSGGQRIAESGELDEAIAAVGLHVHPLLQTGKIAYVSGQALAAVSSFKITIKGKSGHAGAAPHLAIDAIFIASNLIQAIQSIVSRNVPPTEPTVISITKINGGTASNIIADTVILEGTVRSLNLDNYEFVMNRLGKVLEGVAFTFGADILLDVNHFVPSLLNNDSIHLKLKDPLEKIFSKENIVIEKPLLGGEDFAFYSRKIPSVFYFIGAKDTKDPCYFIHHPKVIFNEECIPFGSSFLANAAVELLSN